LYTVLLIDDEHIVLDTLLNYVEWNKLSLHVVGTARNGKEAFNKVCLLHPDILITDIKMPIVDGIELASKVHQHFPEIQIVFLTGYDEFEYAHSAIKMGAAGYLLKPIDYSELAVLMESVQKKCEEQKNKKNASLPAAGENLRELLQGKVVLPDGLVEKTSAIFAQSIGISTDIPKFYFSIISIDEYTLLSEYMPHTDPNAKTEIIGRLESLIANLPSVCAGILVRLWDGHWLFISSKNHFSELSLWQKNSPDTEHWVSIFSTTKTTLLSFVQQWPTIYHQRKLHIATTGPGLTVMLKKDIHKDFIRETPLPYVSELVEAIWNGKHEKVKVWLDDFYDNGIPKTGMKQVFADTMDFFNYIQKNVIETNSTLLQIYERDGTFINKLFVMESSHCMKMLVTQLVMAIMEGLETKKSDRKTIIVHEVCAIIKKDFSKPLSVDILAEKVYLSPNYLSTVFKDITGKTLLEYITDVRIKEAEKMLQHTKKKIHEIALAVGYESPSYFSSIFYRNKGLTPNQYRITSRK